jgi:uracil-DNA glycosylase
MARCKPRGPLSSKVVIVGEAPGEREEKWGVPFVGATGDLLKQLLQESGFDPSSCYYTNVFMDRPPNNLLGAFCVKGEEAKEEAVSLGWPSYPFESLSQGLYIKPYYCLELLRLKEEIEEVNPNLVIALGNTAIWALLGTTGINKWRGAISPGHLTKHKVLPTFHPAMIFRAWHQRVVVLMDLIKAKHESSFPEIRYTPRELWVSPTLQDLQIFYEKIQSSQAIAVDIETHTFKSKGRFYPFISMVGFAISPFQAFCIPFIKPDGSHYWSTLEEEQQAWDWVQEIMNLPQPKILQNGAGFDIHHLYRNGIAVWHYDRDTMVKHHALYLGMQKGLGFMGSIYANEGPWKQYRPKSKLEKAEE